MKVCYRWTIVAILNLSGSPAFSQTSKGIFTAGGSLSYGYDEHDFFIFSYAQSFSQVEKGTWSVGASLNYERPSKYINAYSINPSAHYFIFNRLSVGIIVPIFHGETVEARGGEYSKFEGYAIGPVLRYYIPIFPRFYLAPFFEYSFGYERLEKSTDTPDEDGTFDLSVAQFRLGTNATYFIGKHISVEGSIYLQNRYTGMEGGEDILPNYGLGIQYYFRKNI